MGVLGVHFARLQASVENLVTLTPQLGFKLSLVHGQIFLAVMVRYPTAAHRPCRPGEPCRGRNYKEVRHDYRSKDTLALESGHRRRNSDRRVSTGKRTVMPKRHRSVADWGIRRHKPAFVGGTILRSLLRDLVLLHRSIGSGSRHICQI